MAGVHPVHSDILFKVVSQNYGNRWSVADLEILRKVRAFKHKMVNMVWPVCIHGLFTVKSYLLNYVKEDISMFGGTAAWKRCGTNSLSKVSKIVYCHKFKRRATRIDETVFVRINRRPVQPGRCLAKETNYLQSYPIKRNYA